MKVLALALALNFSLLESSYAACRTNKAAHLILQILGRKDSVQNLTILSKHFDELTNKLLTKIPEKEIVGEIERLIKMREDLRLLGSGQRIQGKAIESIGDRNFSEWIRREETEILLELERAEETTLGEFTARQYRRFRAHSGATRTPTIPDEWSKYPAELNQHVTKSRIQCRGDRSCHRRSFEKWFKEKYPNLCINNNPVSYGNILSNSGIAVLVPWVKALLAPKNDKPLYETYEYELLLNSLLWIPIFEELNCRNFSKSRENFSPISPSSKWKSVQEYGNRYLNYMKLTTGFTASYSFLKDVSQSLRGQHTAEDARHAWYSRMTERFLEGMSVETFLGGPLYVFFTGGLGQNVYPMIRQVPKNVLKSTQWGQSPLVQTTASALGRSTEWALRLSVGSSGRVIYDQMSHFVKDTGYVRLFQPKYALPSPEEVLLETRSSTQSSHPETLFKSPRLQPLSEPQKASLTKDLSLLQQPSENDSDLLLTFLAQTGRVWRSIQDCPSCQTTEPTEAILEIDSKRFRRNSLGIYQNLDRGNPGDLLELSWKEDRLLLKFNGKPPKSTKKILATWRSLGLQVEIR